MSRATLSPLHVEWTPAWVRVLDVATGEKAEAASLGDLTSSVAGHQEALVGVGHNYVFLKSLRLPKAAPDDLRAILSVQIGQLFPLSADQLSFDFIQTSDINAEGCLTVVGAIRSDDLLRIRAELRQIGLKLRRMLPLSLAAAGVASRAGYTDALVAESGPSGLALDVIQEGILRFSRVAPESSDPVTEVQRTLAAARAGALPVVTVGGADLPGAVPSLDTPLSLLHEAPAFNFELAEDRIREAKKRVVSRTWLAAGMMLAAICFFLYVWLDHQDAQAKVTHSQGVWAGKLTTDKSINQDATDKASRALAIQAKLDRAFKPGQTLSDLCSVVDDALPPGAWLTGINLERGKPMEVRGTAKTSADVTQFVDNLGTDPVFAERFRDVRLIFANSAVVGEAPVVQFNVTAVCVGNLPVPAPDKTSGGSAGVQVAQATGDGG